MLEPQDTAPFSYDFTQQGMPQTDENPAMAEMFRPAMEAQQAEIDAFQKWQKDTTDYIDKGALDFDNYAPEYDEKTRKSALVSAYLTLQNGGQDTGSGLSADILRAQVANDRFQGRGADNDEAFFGEIQKESQGRKDQGDLLADLNRTAQQAASLKKGGLPMPYDKPGDQGKTFQQWREEAKKRPGYDPKRDADYLEAWETTRQTMEEATAAFRPQLNRVWDAMSGLDKQGLGGNSSAYDEAFKAYDEMSAKERPLFMAALRNRVDALPQEQQAAFWSNLNRSASRAFKDFGTDAINYATQLTGYLAAANAPESAGTVTSVSEGQKRINFASDVRGIQQSDYDPVKVLSTSTAGKWAEQVAYGTPSALVSMGSMLIPGAGPAMFYASIAGSEYQSARREMLKNGLSEEDANMYASTVAPINAGLQGAIEHLQVAGVTGKVPGFNKLMDGITSGVQSRALRFLGRGAVSLVAQGAEETSQDLIAPALQEIGHAIDPSIPDAVWHDPNGKDGALDGFWMKFAVNAGTVGPLAIVTATGGTDTQARAKVFAESSDQALRAFGIPQAGVDAIRSGLASGEYSGNQAIEAALESRDPNSEEAKAAAEEMARQAEATQQAQLSGVLPRFERTADGWTVYDGETNEEVGQAANAADAMRLANAHSAAMDESNADQTSYLFTTLQAMEDQSARDSGDRKTTTEFRPGEQLTEIQVAARSSQDDARVMAQAEARERASGGDGSISRVVFGESQTDFAQRQRKTINRLQQGASVLTVFHEETHGFYREAIESGRLTREETLQAIRAIESGMRGQTTKDGKPLQLLKESDDARVTDVALDEAVSELMESEIVRTRKGGGVRELPAGIVSKNLSALARMSNKKAGRNFKAFVDAVKSFWSVTLGRAAHIKKALASGDLDQAKYEGFLRKVLGLEEQDEHNAAAAKVANRILQGSAFALSPIGVGTREITEAPEIVRLKESPFGDAKPANAHEWRQAWKQWEKSHRSEWRGEISLPEGMVRISEPTAREIGEIRRQDAMHHFEAAAALPDLLRNSVLAAVESPREGKDNVQEVHKRYAWMQNSDGSRHHVLITLMRWKGERVTADSAYSVESIQVQKEAAAGSSGLSSRPTAASAAKGDEDKLAEFQAGIKPEHRHDTGSTSLSVGPAALADAVADSAREKLWRVGNEKGKMHMLQRVADAMADAKRAIEDKGAIYGRADFSGTDQEQRLQEIDEKREALSQDHDDALERIDQDEREALQDGRAKLLEKLGPQDGQTREGKHAFREAVRQMETKTREKFAKAREAESSKLDAAHAELDAREQKLTQRAALSDQRQATLDSLAILDGVITALPSDLRGKVGGYTTLASLRTDKARSEYLEKKLNKASEVVEKWLRKEYGKALEKLLDRAKPAKDKAGKKPKGKLGADVHALFDVLRDAKTWDAEDVSGHVAKLEKKIADGTSNGTLTPEQEAHWMQEAALVELVGDWKNADAARRAAAVQSADYVFATGYMEFKLAKMKEKDRRDQARADLIKDTGKDPADVAARQQKQLADEKLQGRWKSAALGLFSFEQMAHWVFGEESTEAKRLVDNERNASFAKEDAIQERMDGLDDLFKSLAGGDAFAAEKLRYELSQPSITMHGSSRWAGQSYSQLKGVAATMMWAQEDGRRHMLGHLDEQGNPVAGGWHYNQDFIDQIEAKLSPEALAVRAYLQGEYAKEWGRLNPVFRELNGVNLPKNSNYSPLTVKPMQAGAGEMVDPVTGQAHSGTSTTPGSLRNRSKTAVAEPEFRDALQTFIAHTKQMEHWLAYAKFSNDAMALLNNRTVLNGVLAKSGESAVSALRSWVDNFAQGGTRDAAAHLGMNKTLSRMTSRAASAALVGRLSVLAVQSVQLGAALAEMPTGAYLARFAKLTTGQLGWGEALKSDYIQRRLKQMPPVVQQAMQGLSHGKPTMLKHQVAKLGGLINGADALFTAGTYAIVFDYQLSQAKAAGLSGDDASEFAREAAERSVDRIAQPTRAGTRSLYENLSTSPQARLVWAFASESRQKLMLSAYALAKKPLPEKMRALATTWIIGSLFTNLIRAAYKDLRDDDDDEVFDEKNWSAKKLALQTLTGPFQGLPVIGDMIAGAAYKASGEHLPEGNLFSGFQRAASAIGNIDEWGEKDAMGIVKDVDAILTGMAVAGDHISAAASLSHLAKDFFEVVDNITGE